MPNNFQKPGTCYPLNSRLRKATAKALFSKNREIPLLSGLGFFLNQNKLSDPETKLLSYYCKANSIALVNKSSNEIPAAFACCGIKLSVVNPGIVFISNI